MHYNSQSPIERKEPDLTEEGPLPQESKPRTLSMEDEH